MVSKRNQTKGSDNSADLQLLGSDLRANIDRISTDFGCSSDLVVNVVSPENTLITLASVYIKDMTDAQAANVVDDILAQIISENKRLKPENLHKMMANSFGTVRTTSAGADFKSLYKEILAGHIVFIISGFDKYLSVDTASDDGRAIAEPTSQTNIKGPKDAFTENIDKNVYLVRKRIRNEALRVDDITLGTVTHTKIKLLYMNGIARQDIVDDLKDRIEKIDYDGIIGSSYIEEIIKTDQYSVFPTSFNSERPDNIVGGLLDGRVAIICDGTPYVLLIPAIFSDFIQSSDDYYENFYIASMMRIARYAALIFTLLVPATFVALITFHQEVIPTPLLISIAAQREGVPFPALFEVLIMDSTFELLREAGIRMPRAVGSAISIVGALVLGQAAVEAGFVSAATVIVISLTAISSFAIPNYAMHNAIRILRFGFLFLAGMLGFYGITMGLILLLLHLCKLKSASVPYLEPIAPQIPGGSKDIFLRYPVLKNKYRPSGISAAKSPRTNGQNTMDPKINKKPEFK